MTKPALMAATQFASLVAFGRREGVASRWRVRRVSVLAAVAAFAVACGSSVEPVMTVSPPAVSPPAVSPPAVSPPAVPPLASSRLFDVLVSGGVDADRACEEVARQAAGDYGTAVRVAGAFATNIAGLRRAAGRATTFDPKLDQADKWPGVPGDAEGFLCYLDGLFSDVPGFQQPVERVVAGVTPGSWVVLDFGPKSRLAMVAP